MKVERRHVTSDHIASVGFRELGIVGNESYGVLQIEFKSGKIAEYSDVPRRVWHELMIAPSIGSAFHSLIRSANFAFKYVTEEGATCARK